MIKKIIVISFFSTLAFGSSHLALLSDTKVLKDPPRVQSILQDHGFKKVFFKSTDGVKICGLFLDRSKQLKEPVKGTIIYSAGFYPGTKEGMTTFYSMLHDRPYNFLFYDARGHNESEGSLFSLENLRKYGSNEYRDTVGAIEFIDRYNERHNIVRNMILHGVCSGAFHNVKALDEMNKTNHPALPHVHGMIIDSGWGSLTDIVEPTIQAEIRNRFKDSCFSFLTLPITYIMLKAYQWGFKHHHNKVESIYDSIKSISCPTFFIHSKHDPYAPCESAKRLYDTLPHATAWWEDSDSHTTCNLKHHDEYKEKVDQFLGQL